MTHQVPKVGGKCSGRLQLTQQRVTEMEVIPPGKSGMVLMMEQKQGANPPDTQHSHRLITPLSYSSTAVKPQASPWCSFILRLHQHTSVIQLRSRTSFH
ncbi:hypothetical protein QQF64_008420 [Cirrhinus molitorella]|uniref:Uncharacterized protein n=1 Tax=Cirrhinus molitorella TaxID=172907 RepID=A0ABR3M636_9TELE